MCVSISFADSTGHVGILEQLNSVEHACNEKRDQKPFHLLTKLMHYSMDEHVRGMGMVSLGAQLWKSQL